MKKIYLMAILTIITILTSIPLVLAHTVIINPNGNVITIKPTGYAANDIDPDSVVVKYYTIPKEEGPTIVTTVDPIKVVTNSKQAIIVLSVADLPEYANSTAIEVDLLTGGSDVISGPGFAWRRR